MGYNALIMQFIELRQKSFLFPGFIFPEHIHPALERVSINHHILANFPEHPHPIELSTNLMFNVFRSIPTHLFIFRNYLRTVRFIKGSCKSDMAGKIIDMSKIKQVLLLHQDNFSNRKIANSLNLDKGTVNNYIRKAKLDSLGIDKLLSLEDPILESRFFSGNPAYSDERMDVFLSKLSYYKEQLDNPKNHVTKFTLWNEYISDNPNGYSKSQFYFHLKQNLIAIKSPVTVLSNLYEPGQKLFIDFAGDTLSYIDIDTGNEVKVQVFVATMPYSDYAYAICVPSQKLEDFVFAMRMCLEYLGGVPSIVVPDNLKSAVIKADKYEPIINKAFEDMGNHYGFAILPARSASPRDKALVENQVKLIYNRVYSKLRKLQYYSLIDLNKAVSDLVSEHNQTRMQQRPYTREERFHAKEKERLKELPSNIYEIKKYANVKVLPNGRVYLSKDKHYYSVPYSLIGRNANIIFTRSIVKIYIDKKCVATHLRSYEFGYTDIKEHLAPNSLAYLERSPEEYCNKAGKVSIALEKLFQSMFMNKSSGVVNEVYYRRCDKMLKLQRNTNKDSFDAACKICTENKLFNGDSLENIINNIANITVSDNADVNISNKENTRGDQFFNNTTEYGTRNLQNP